MDGPPKGARGPAIRAPRLASGDGGSGGTVTTPQGWRVAVNRPKDERELAALRMCLHRGRSFGADFWTRRTAMKLGLESTLSPVGRLKKSPPAA